MEVFLRAYIMSSTFSAIMRLANYGDETRPDKMSQSDFERSIALEVAEQAKNLAEMDDEGLDVLRRVIIKE